MARNIFVGRSQAWLETQLKLAQADYAAGKMVTSYGEADVNVGKMEIVKIEDRIDQLLYALHLIDPGTYPATSIRRQTVTVGRFRDR